MKFFIQALFVFAFCARVFSLLICLSAWFEGIQRPGFIAVRAAVGTMMAVPHFALAQK